MSKKPCNFTSTTRPGRLANEMIRNPPTKQRTNSSSTTTPPPANTTAPHTSALDAAHTAGMRAGGGPAPKPIPPARKHGR